MKVLSILFVLFLVETIAIDAAPSIWSSLFGRFGKAVTAQEKLAAAAALKVAGKPAAEVNAALSKISPEEKAQLAAQAFKIDRNMPLKAPTDVAARYPNVQFKPTDVQNIIDRSANKKFSPVAVGAVSGAATLGGLAWGDHLLHKGQAAAQTTAADPSVAGQAGVDPFPASAQTTAADPALAQITAVDPGLAQTAAAAQPGPVDQQTLQSQTSQYLQAKGLDSGAQSPATVQIVAPIAAPIPYIAPTQQAAANTIP